MSGTLNAVDEEGQLIPSYFFFKIRLVSVNSCPEMKSRLPFVVY